MAAKHQLIFASAFFILAPSAQAEYVKTGQATGTECNGLVVKVCTPHNIDAIEKDGQLYELKDIWQSVDKYNQSSGKCTIYPKGTSSNIISQGINDIKKPILLERNGTKYNRVDADYVIFPCIKR